MEERNRVKKNGVDWTVQKISPSRTSGAAVFITPVEDCGCTVRSTVAGHKQTGLFYDGRSENNSVWYLISWLNNLH